MLGDITVASHLGEPFHAAIPLTLDAGETVNVGVAAPADYRSLGVRRDHALNGIRVDIVADNRIELSSSAPVDAPFLTLVLKVRGKQTTRFKTYPVFLDPAHSGTPLGRQNPAPEIKAGEPEQAAVATASASRTPALQPAAGAGGTAEPVSAHAFMPFDGWARTSHYGPIVRGDTLDVISKRLRIDERYTFNQVMAALFEKNRDRFAENNLNLPRDGAFLDVPTAAEVERNTPGQALAIVEDHERRWKELQKQARYAAIAKAQRERYSKR